MIKIVENKSRYAAMDVTGKYMGNHHKGEAFYGKVSGYTGLFIVYCRAIVCLSNTAVNWGWEDEGGGSIMVTVERFVDLEITVKDKKS